MANKKIYLAVDSGGSKTLWVLINEDGDKVFEYKTQGVASAKPGILPVSQTIEEAANALKKFDNPQGIYLSLGGPNTEEVYDCLKAVWPGTDIVVERESTANAILFAASFFGCSAAIMCGTGSVAMGEKDGRRCYSGGWGPIYGDGGSGGGMGSDALKMFLRHIDNMEDIGKVADLFSHLTDGLNIKEYDDRMELKSRALSMTRRELASLAPKIYELAEQGEAQAVKLYKNAAEEVALLANEVCDNNTDTQVMLCGGFFADKPLFLDYCKEAFAKKSKAKLLYNDSFSPIIAAEITALKNNQIEITSELFNKIINS